MVKGILAAASRLGPPYFIPGIDRLPSQEPRPYFGYGFKNIGGPHVRTRRLIKTFGNHWINPNLIYANSVGFVRLGTLKKVRGSFPDLPVVLNQNGTYYPAWYAESDWRAKNQELVEFQKLSQFTIFQSRFCRQAIEELTGFQGMMASDVIYNSVPDVLQKRDWTKWIAPERPRLFLSGVFDPSSQHILEPALRAIQVLAQRTTATAPVLMLSGKFTPKTQTLSWYADLWSTIQKLETQGHCRWLGEYAPSIGPSILNEVSLVLHLKYKDPCPNAVIERMAHGLGHIFSQSGGTPELVEDSGIGLKVGESWDRMIPVDLEELLAAIDQGLKNRRELGVLARQRYEQHFRWEPYIEKHLQIFQKALG